MSWALSNPLALSHLESGHAVTFLHRISVVRVYLSIAATTQDPAGWDPHQEMLHGPTRIRVIKTYTNNYTTIAYMLEKNNM